MHTRKTATMAAAAVTATAAAVSIVHGKRGCEECSILLIAVAYMPSLMFSLTKKGAAKKMLDEGGGRRERRWRVKEGY